MFYRPSAKVVVSDVRYLSLKLLMSLAMVGKRLTQVVSLFSEEEATRLVWGYGIVDGGVLHHCVWLKTPDHDGEHGHCRYLGHRGVAESTSPEWQLADTIFKTAYSLPVIWELVCCWSSNQCSIIKNSIL
jgi:hypothetical protein